MTGKIIISTEVLGQTTGKTMKKIRHENTENNEVGKQITRADTMRWSVGKIGISNCVERTANAFSVLWQKDAWQCTRNSKGKHH